ncbi:LamG domain-containing protein [Cellulomonas sp. NPDC055163]
MRISSRCLPLVLATVLAFASLALVETTTAAFTATLTTPASTLTAAEVFPTYPDTVTEDTPDVYHQMEDLRASTTTSDVADATSNARVGKLNGASNGPATWWRFNADTTFAADSSGAVDSGAPQGSAVLSGSAGRTGGRLHLDGSPGSYVKGATGVLDTAQSFTAAIWAKLTDLDGDYAAMAMEGSAQSGFGLMFRGACTCWELRTTTGDTAPDTSAGVTSTRSAANTAAEETWTHLAVTYDEDTRTKTFYVNGVAQNATSQSSTWTGWKAAGHLVVGRQTGGGGPRDYFKGSLDEAIVYQQSLTGAQVDALYAGVPTVQWHFDEGKGTTTRDLSGNGVTPTFGSTTGVQWNLGGRSSAAVRLDGTTDGYLSTSTNPVDTSRSFTVSALVRLNSGLAVDGADHTVLSQKGSITSGFILRYADVDSTTGTDFRWVFMMPRTDSANPAVDQARAPASLNVWTQLTAVHDATAGTLSLYVNGSAVGTTTATHTSTFVSSGGLQVGRAWSDNTWKGYFPGLVDHVTAYPHALTASQVATLATADDASRSTAQVPGALTGPGQDLAAPLQGLAARTAIAYRGVDGGYSGSSTSAALASPTTFTAECWFRTTTTTGGQIIGFSERSSGVMGGRIDRMVFMTDDGRLNFVISGTLATSGEGVPQLRSPADKPYNDGAWHHVAATFTDAPTTDQPGAALYVDGVAVAQSTIGAAITPVSYNGYWRWGAAQVRNWTVDPTTNAFTGSIDEVAIYPYALTPGRIANHAFSNF